MNMIYLRLCKRVGNVIVNIPLENCSDDFAFDAIRLSSSVGYVTSWNNCQRLSKGEDLSVPSDELRTTLLQLRSQVQSQSSSTGRCLGFGFPPIKCKSNEEDTRVAVAKSQSEPKREVRTTR